MVESTVEKAGQTSTERRFHISSAALDAACFAHAVRAHWTIENQLHWVLDVQFKDDLSRLRTGHGAHNMAIVRHFALNLVRGMDDRRRIKTRHQNPASKPGENAPHGTPNTYAQSSNPCRVNMHSLPCMSGPPLGVRTAMRISGSLTESRTTSTSRAAA